MALAHITALVASATPEQRREMVTLLNEGARRAGRPDLILAGGEGGAGAPAAAKKPAASVSRLTEPDQVKEWVEEHWLSHLSDPETREAFISSKGEGTLTTQDVKNIFHWLCGADDNVRRSYKNTARCSSMTAVYSEICDRLEGYDEHRWRRGDRYAKMRGPRSGSRSGSDDDE